LTEGAGFSFDFTDVEENTGYKPLPSGTYQFNVSDPKMGETDAGDEKFTVALIGAEDSEIANRRIPVTFTFAKPYARSVAKNFFASLEDEKGQAVFPQVGNVTVIDMVGDDDKPSRVAGAVVSAQIILRVWGEKDEKKGGFRPLMNPLTKEYNRIEVYLPTRRPRTELAVGTRGRSRPARP